MKLSLGFSPCPNDTFLFDALVHNKIDTKGLTFDIHLADVEALNLMAFKGELDISKLSYHAFCYLTDQYQLLNSGSALGQNCGPLLIAKKQLTDKEIRTGPVAIPGKYTTAHFLLKMAFPNIKIVKKMLFSEIETAVLEGKVDAGVIIHENRFTYEDKGLVKLMDLGENWETQSKKAIPLGGICIKKSIDLDLKQTVDELIMDSVKYAFNNPDSSKYYVASHSQEMDPEICKQHIALYVNHFTEHLGQDGRDAIDYFLEKAVKIGLIDQFSEDYLVPSKK